MLHTTAPTGASSEDCVSSFSLPFSSDAAIACKAYKKNSYQLYFDYWITLYMVIITKLDYMCTGSVKGF